MLIWRDEWRLVLTSGCARRATPCSVTSVRLVRTRAEGLGRPAWGAVGAFGCLLSARRARSARCARSALHGVKKTRGAMAIQGLQSPCQSELVVNSYGQIKIQSNRLCIACALWHAEGSDEAMKVTRSDLHCGRSAGLQTSGQREVGQGSDEGRNAWVRKLIAPVYGCERGGRRVASRDRRERVITFQRDPGNLDGMPWIFCTTLLFVTTASEARVKWGLAPLKCSDRARSRKGSHASS